MMSSAQRNTSSRFAGFELFVPEPPSEALPHGELTLAEMDAELLTVKSENDPNLDRYMRGGGVRYPTIIIPETTPADSSSMGESEPGMTKSKSSSLRPSRPVTPRAGKGLESVYAPTSAGTGRFSPSEGPLWSRVLGTAFITLTRVIMAVVSLARTPLTSMSRWLFSSSLSGWLGTSTPSAPPTWSKKPIDGPISAFAWHPHQGRYAVALADGSIAQYDLSRESWIGSRLYAEAQEGGVWQMAYAPQSGSKLAVAAADGVVLWTTQAHDGNSVPSAGSETNGDFVGNENGGPLSPSGGSGLRQRTPFPRTPSSTSGALRDIGNITSQWLAERGSGDGYSSMNGYGSGVSSRTSVLVLKSAGHAPVNSVAWSPDGRHLASCSTNDFSILIWEPASGTAVPLRRVDGGGCSLLSWSPSGWYLLAGTTSTVFRVWETLGWTQEKWSTSSSASSSAVNGACWSSDGRSVLVSSRGSSSLSVLQFPGTPPVLEGRLVREEDLCAVPVTTSSLEHPYVTVGGAVTAMAWDPSGSRLAIAFEKEEGEEGEEGEDQGEGSGRELVALFGTKSAPVPSMFPIGFIRGPRGARRAKHLAFQPEFPHGALLAICWDTGKIGFVPMY